MVVQVAKIVETRDYDASAAVGNSAGAHRVLLRWVGSRRLSPPAVAGRAAQPRQWHVGQTSERPCA